MTEVQQLVQLLADKVVRIESIVALVGGITATELRKLDRLDDEVFGALVEGLGDRNPKVRWWCVQLLDHVADERAVSAIAPLLDDPVARVRRNAAHALGCLVCKPTADPRLPDGILVRLAELAMLDPNPKVRNEAATAYRCRVAAR